MGLSDKEVNALDIKKRELFFNGSVIPESGRTFVSRSPAQRGSLECEIDSLRRYFARYDYALFQKVAQQEGLALPDGFTVQAMVQAYPDARVVKPYISDFDPNGLAHFLFNDNPGYAAHLGMLLFGLSQFPRDLGTNKLHRDASCFAVAAVGEEELIACVKEYKGQACLQRAYIAALQSR